MTRAHLLTAAEQVFKARGFHDASIDAVAGAAGFTKGAVYSNFTDKADLFIALTEQRYEQQLAAVRRALHDAASLGPEERVDLFERLSTELLWGDKEWLLLFLEFSVYAARHPAAQRRLSERYRTDCATLAPLLGAELERVGARAPLPLDDLAAVFLACFNGIALKHATHPDDDDNRLVQSAITMLNTALDSFPRE
jgi:AcrR family transcriptional regulator